MEWEQRGSRGSDEETREDDSLFKARGQIKPSQHRGRLDLLGSGWRDAACSEQKSNDRFEQDCRARRGESVGFFESFRRLASMNGSVDLMDELGTRSGWFMMSDISLPQATHR